MNDTATSGNKMGPAQLAALAAAKRSARVVGFVIPLALVALQIVVTLVWLPRLPNPMVVHWSGAGVPDGFASPLLNLIMYPIVGGIVALLFFVTKLQGLNDRMRGAETRGVALGPIDRLVPAIVLATAVMICSLNLITTWMQLDLADTTALAPSLGAMLWPWGIGIAAGALGYLAQSKLRMVSNVRGEAGELFELAETERAVWVGSIGASKAFNWTMGLSTLAMVATFLLVLGVRPVEVVGIAIGAFALALVLALWVMCARFDVRIDDLGLEARSMLGWPVLRALAKDVTKVEVSEIHPFGEFGGWGWRISVDGKVGVVMRNGEGIRIEREKGRPLVVTLDDAESAAAVLATAARRARAGEEGLTA